jgi:ribosomal protein L11 methyltransferase
MSLGVALPPYWRIAPAELPLESPDTLNTPGTLLRLAAGPGFGRGDHETTQMCLLALGYLLGERERSAAEGSSKPVRVLDFGAGSGVLAIAAALRGAWARAVEIDPCALEHARRNARLNGVESAIEFSTHLCDPPERFDLVLANVLAAVLLRHAGDLRARLAPGASLVLSGLVATDVPQLIAHYRPFFGGARPAVHERGSWRALVFSSAVTP